MGVAIFEWGILVEPPLYGSPILAMTSPTSMVRRMKAFSLWTWPASSPATKGVRAMRVSPGRFLVSNER
jgi:hypothetical protein